MPALGRAPTHVSSTPPPASVPQPHRARWQARRQEREARLQENATRQREESGPVVLMALDMGEQGTGRSRPSTAWSDKSTRYSCRSGGADRRTGRSSSRDGSNIKKRPQTGEASASSGHRGRRSGTPSSLLQSEASVALDASRALNAGERSRLQKDSAERKRSKLLSDVREAIAREGVYRDPHIDAGTVVRVGMVGGPQADNRPVVDRHGRFFGMGAMGRARQVAHAQEVMAGGPLTPESNRRVLPLAVPVTPQMAAAPHSRGSPMLLHTHISPSGDGRKQGGFARRPSTELRALDSIYETKLRGGKPRQYHHLGGARHTDTIVGAGYVVEGPPRGYVTGPLTEVQWGPTAVERGGVAPSAAVASNKGGLGVREYTAVQPAVRRIGGATDPNWERRRPTLHKLHPDAEELLELQKGWSEGWGKAGRRRSGMNSRGGTGNGWKPPLVANLHEAHGRLVGNWESEEAAAAAAAGEDSLVLRTVDGNGSMPAVFSHKSQPRLYDGEYRRSLSLREALES